MEYNTPGQRLRNIRENLKLSQTELANSLTLGQAAICHYENGNRKIPGSIILLLKEFYHVNPDYIISGKQPMFFSSDSIQDLRTEKSDLTSEDQSFLAYYLKSDVNERKRIRSLAKFKP